MVKSLAMKEAARQPKASTTSSICALAALSAAWIRPAWLRCAPTSPRLVCTTAAASATHSAKCPIPAIMAGGSRLHGGAGGATGRMSRLPQRLGGFRRHVVLVMLGQHLAGGEDAVRTQ